MVHRSIFKAPARRRRLYVVMTLRGKVRLARPLIDLVGVIKRIYPTGRTWEDLFCLDGVDDCFSASVAKRAKRYLQKFNEKAGAYDLDQCCWRLCCWGRPLFGLTAHTRMVWSPSADRCLRRSELAAAMGVPCHPALSIAYGLPAMSFDHLSRSAAARLCCNGMCVPCVGSVMHWCSVFCSADFGDIPSTLADPIVEVPGKLKSTDLCDSTDRIVTDRVPVLASAVTWKVLRSLGSALCEHSMFTGLANALKSARKPLDRDRELFPLPIVHADYLGKFGATARDDVDDVREYLLGVVVGLNCPICVRVQY